MTILRVVLVLLAFHVCVPASGQQPDESYGGGREQFPAAALYRRLSSVGLDPTRVYRIRDAHLDREDLHAALANGVIAFTQTVDGRITGAFFEGDGELLLAPPDRVERWSLSQFTGAAILEEQFTTAYLRFNDDTFAELEPSLRPFEPAPAVTDEDTEEGDARPQQNAPATAQDFVNKWNSVAQTLAQTAALRLLVTFGDAETPNADGRARWSPPANDRVLQLRVVGSRRGIFDVYYDSRAAEQLTVAQPKTVNSVDYYDIWTSFPSHSARERVHATRAATVQTQTAAEAVSDPIHIPRYVIRAHIQPPSRMEADTVMDLQAEEPGHRVLLFELSRFLKLSEVTMDGTPLEFVQNEAVQGSDLARRGNDRIAVVFPNALTPGRRVQLRFSYGGEVLSDAGGGLLYVGARGTWYPNRGLAMSDYDMEFRYPAGWTLVATGKLLPASVAQSARGGGSEGEQVEHYASERPLPVAGFNLGRYVKAETKAGAVVVQAYAARAVETGFPGQKVAVADTLPDPYSGQRSAEVRILPRAAPQPSEHAQKLAEGMAHTIEFLGTRLGPFPYSTLSLTQMPGRSSQGWPGLIYLSSFVFLSPEERARTHPGRYEELLYSRLMPAHEVAHQWWGDSLLWESYREQWLVEALSNYCVLLMIEQQDPAGFRVAMEEYRRDLLRESRSGGPISDAGPVTLGVRLDSSRSPEAYELIAYGRGTWLFHMLRHMLLDSGVPEAQGDRAFFAVLRSLREHYEGKSITTRDVQRAFEQALPPTLQYEGRRSLDWFFDGWVNGTAIPHLQLNGVKLIQRGGSLIASGTVLQTNAPSELVTSVPLYAVGGASKPVLLGRIFAEGPQSTFHLPAPAGTKKILLDPYNTILTRP